MINIDKTEKRFDSDIEVFFLTPEGGYTKGTAPYGPDLGLFDSVLTDSVKGTQPKAWLGSRRGLSTNMSLEDRYDLI